MYPISIERMKHTLLLILSALLLFSCGQSPEKKDTPIAAIERYMAGESVSEAEKAVIERYHRISEHKRTGRVDYKG